MFMDLVRFSIHNVTIRKSKQQMIFIGFIFIKVRFFTGNKLLVLVKSKFAVFSRFQKILIYIFDLKKSVLSEKSSRNC